jgi:hypothetical protein
MMREGRNGGKLKSGNTKNVGRPKDLPKQDDALISVLGIERDGITGTEALFRSLMNLAMKGNVRAAELILERAYGKPTQDLHVGMRLTEVIMPKPPKELDK